MDTDAPVLPSRTTPVPVRFSEAEKKMLADLKQRTGLAASNIVRRAVRLAVPKFLSGEINPLDVPDAEVAGAAPAK